ncbi:MAG: hypothetical protein QXV31_00830, partial [Zestosphaera sp.]
EVWASYKSLMYRARLREASELVVKLSEKGNQYVNVKAPWAKIKENVDEVKSTLNVGFTAVLTLSIMLYPITPQSSKKLLKTINVDDEGIVIRNHPLELVKLPHKINKPEQVFTKIPQKLVDILLDDYKREQYSERVRSELNNERPEVLRF